MDFNSCRYEFLHLCKWKNIPNTSTSCDTNHRCLVTWWIWVRNVCTSEVSWLFPCNSSSSFWTCHTLSPISSSRLCKKKKETKNNGWVISYVSSQHHNSSMSVKSLLYFRPPPPFIRFGDSKGAADSSYRIIWLVSKYKSFSRRWPMIKSSFFRPVIQDWLPEDIQQNSTY